MRTLTAARLLGTGIALTAHLAGAFTYNDQDALLIFRADGYDNIEFNLGNVSQFLNHTNGFQKAVTNWNPDLVNSNFSLTNGLAQFAIVASTSDQDANPRAWVTDSQPLVSAQDITASQWEGLYSTIVSIGAGPQQDPDAPVNANYDVLVPTTRYAFDYIASNGGQTPSQIPYLGGKAGLKFSTSGFVPNTLLFYEIQPSSLIPKPAATLVGSFNLTATGALIFQAGPLLDSARIASANVIAGVSTVAFNTKVGVKYRLRYSTQVTADFSAWTIVPGSVVGNGALQTLQDNPGTDQSRFYVIESYQ